MKRTIVIALAAFFPVAASADGHGHHHGHGHGHHWDDDDWDDGGGPRWVAHQGWGGYGPSYGAYVAPSYGYYANPYQCFAPEYGWYPCPPNYAGYGY
jgi:hypothetical protein